MALFRKKNKSVAELEEYYSRKQAQSNLSSWLMAFISLVITIIAVVALFYGGRWLYRTITDTGSNDDTSQVEVTDPTGLDEQTEGSSTNDASSADGAASDGSTSDSSTDSQTSSEGVVSDEAATTSVPSDNNQNSNGNTTSGSSSDVAGTSSGNDQDGSDASSIAGSNGEIANTGPGDYLIIAPILAAISGYYYSLKRQAKR